MASASRRRRACQTFHSFNGLIPYESSDQRAAKSHGYFLSRRGIAPEFTDARTQAFLSDRWLAGSGCARGVGCGGALRVLLRLGGVVAWLLLLAGCVTLALRICSWLLLALRILRI